MRRGTRRNGTAHQRWRAHVDPSQRHGQDVALGRDIGFPSSARSGRRRWEPAAQYRRRSHVAPPHARDDARYHRRHSGRAQRVGSQRWRSGAETRQRGLACAGSWFGRAPERARFHRLRPRLDGRSRWRRRRHRRRWCDLDAAGVRHHRRPSRGRGDRARRGLGRRSRRHAAALHRRRIMDRRRPRNGCRPARGDLRGSPDRMGGRRRPVRGRSCLPLSYHRRRGDLVSTDCAVLGMHPCRVLRDAARRMGGRRGLGHRRRHRHRRRLRHA